MSVKLPSDFAADLKCTSVFSYLAGIVDGEGTIYVQRFHEKGKKPVYHRINVTIVNTDPWIILYTQHVFGGRIRKKKRADNHWGIKPCYNWEVSGAKAEAALLQLYPYLFLKKRQAKLCLIMRSMKRGSKRLTPELVETRNKIWQQVKDANHNVEQHGLPEEFLCQ